MPGNKPRSIYRKKRKGRPVNRLQNATLGSSQLMDTEGPSQIDGFENNDLCSNESLEDLERPKISASKRKLEKYQMNPGGAKRPRKEGSQDQEGPSSLAKSSDCSVSPDITSYRLINIDLLSKAMGDVHKCKAGHLTLKEDEAARYGLMSLLYVECSTCGKRTLLPTSSNICNGRGKSFDVNRRAVYCVLQLGIGFSGLETFCSSFNMPCLAETSFHKQKEVIVSVIENEVLDELDSAGARLRDLLRIEKEDVTEKSLEDIAVSFDGTWAKRGHTSLFCVVFVVSVDSGEVLDYHMLSKHCKACSQWESKRVASPFEYNDWKLKHLQSGDCTINFEGSSPAMEMEGASVLWHRSVRKHNFRYKYMLSDGDSKAFHRVSNDKPYGSDFEISKLDCIGHIQKRMGKRLMNLKSVTKGKLGDGKFIGGKGRLTDVMIKKIQRYYGLAIRQNVVKTANPSEKEKETSIYQMKKNIMAILSHIIARDDLKQQHRYCPVGLKSWCAWQRHQAVGSTNYNAFHCLPEVFLDILKPIFMALSNADLLQRCVLGGTQNANESLNSLVWLHCPKHRFGGAKTVKYAAAAAILAFNGGSKRLTGFVDNLGTPVSEVTMKRFEKKDRKRINESQKSIQEKEKVRRALQQQLKATHEEALRQKEGVSYEAGSF